MLDNLIVSFNKFTKNNKIIFIIYCHPQRVFKNVKRTTNF